MIPNIASLSLRTDSILGRFEREEDGDERHLHAKTILLQGDLIQRILLRQGKGLSDADYMELSCQWSRLDTALIENAYFVQGSTAMGCKRLFKKHLLVMESDDGTVPPPPRSVLQSIYDFVFRNDEWNRDKIQEDLKMEFAPEEVAEGTDKFYAIMQSESGRLPSGGGLQNLGGTCYLNSALQLIRRLPRIKPHLELRAWDKENKVACQVSEIFDRQDRNLKCHRDHMLSFFHTCQQKGWYARSSFQQEDAMEFVRWMLQSAGVIMEPMRIKRETLLENGKKSLTEWKSIERECTVPKNRKERTAQELFDATLTDSAADSKMVTTDRFTGTPPEFFIQSFKRTQQNSTTKKKGAVDFSEGLTIEVDDKQYSYAPVSIIKHTGYSRSGGHYVNYSKHEDGLWYNYNDSTVTKAHNIHSKDVAENLIAIVWLQLTGE